MEELLDFWCVVAGQEESFHKTHVDISFRYIASVAVSRLHEEVGEPLQRVLVHGVHHVKVPHAEVHDGSSVGYGAVPLAALIDFLLRHLSFCNLQQQQSKNQCQHHEFVVALAYRTYDTCILFSNDGMV